MKKLIALAVVSVALTGCANKLGEYYVAVDNANSRKSEMELARQQTELARIQALSAAAVSADPAARASAVMALALSGAAASNSPARDTVMLKPEAPRDPSDTVLKWASLLVPSLTQFYSIQQNAAIAINSSNNALEANKSNNSMIVDLVQGREQKVVVGTEDDVLLYPVAPVVAPAVEAAE